MIEREYKFCFYLNALHSMIIENGKSQNVHPHTWEIILYLNKTNNNFIMFSEIEKEIEIYFSRFEGKVLDDTKEFKKIDSSCENIGEVVFEGISETLRDTVWELSKLEISENSTRTYIINNAAQENFNKSLIKLDCNKNYSNNEMCIEPKMINSVGEEEVKKKRTFGIFRRRV